jgi:hypothetical protein
LQDQIALLKLEGEARDKKALEQKYFDDLIALYDNEEAKKLLLEKYKLDYANIEDRYNTERKQKDEEFKAGQLKVERDQKKALLEAEKTYQSALLDAASSGTDLLKALAGKSRELAYAALIMEKAIAIARILIKMAEANAALRASIAEATAAGAAGGFIGMGISGGAAAAIAIPMINLNRITAALQIATIIAETAKGLAAINSAGKSTPTPAKKHTGGWVTGSSGEVPIIAQKNEYVINRQAMTIPSNVAAVTAINEGAVITTISKQDLIDGVIGALTYIPVIVDENTANKIGIADRKVQFQESRYKQ